MHQQFVQDYNNVNVSFSSLDHDVAHLEGLFFEELKSALLGFHSLPEQLQTLTDEEESEIMKEFENDLPSLRSFREQLDR